MSLRLMDISSNNGTGFDWNGVQASGLAGAICKADQGDYYDDPTFALNWAALEAHGLVRGAYHFADPDRCPPDVSAKHFCNRLPGHLAWGDMLALDIEWPDKRYGDYSPWALAWLRAVEQFAGYPPLLYSYPDYIRHNLTDPALAHYPLWLSALDYLPPGLGQWTSVTLWQDSWNAHVPGVPVAVDEDVIARDRAGLLALGKPAPLPQPAPQKWLVEVDMYARAQPSKAALKQPLQMVHKGAVLNAVTPAQPEHGWIMVDDRGPIWLWQANMRAA